MANAKPTTASSLKDATASTRVGTPLTLLEEHYIHCEARLLVNGGKLVPLSQSIPPPLELIERLRQRALGSKRR